jgi:nitrite reductase/ring-hydroxylating ferredoxin subunit
LEQIMTTIGRAEVLTRLGTCTPSASRFAIRTGANVNAPSTDPRRTYPVEVSAEDVVVDIEQFG